MSFFEPPPRARRGRDLPEIPPAKPWQGAPKNELGAPVPLRMVLARTERVAVAVVGATAYTTGVEFWLAVRRRLAQWADIDDEELDEFFDGDPFEPPFGRPPYRARRRGRDLPPEILRFGVQFSDGRKATTVGDAFPWTADRDEAEGEPPGPILSQGRGGGGDGEWESQFWLWPLPPPGPISFVVEWPAEEIALTRREFDAALFTEASAKSEVLWPENERGSVASWTNYGTLRITGADRSNAGEEDAPS